MRKPFWEDTYSDMNASTFGGPINVVVVFTDRLPPPDDLKDLCIGLFHEGEIFSLYADWEIELEQSYVFDDEHPGGIQHTHPVNKVVARKP